VVCIWTTGPSVRTLQYTGSLETSVSSTYHPSISLASRAQLTKARWFGGPMKFRQPGQGTEPLPSLSGLRKRRRLGKGPELPGPRSVLGSTCYKTCCQRLGPFPLHLS
jgi:hypothetical protein